MDPASEALMRSALHDLANALSGIRGILEMSNPQAPISPRDQARLEAILREGMTVLERSRHLAMGTLPEALMESGLDWRNQLSDQLQNIGTLFRRRFDITYEGDPIYDRWPGEILRGYILALTRQIIAYVPGDLLRIRCLADAKEWAFIFPQTTDIPQSLLESHELQPKDISARWAQRVGQELDIRLKLDSQGLHARIKRF